MKKGVTRTLIDDAGIFGTHVSVDPNISDMDETVNLLKALSPLGRIEALRKIPELANKADELQEQYDLICQKYGPTWVHVQHADGKRGIRFPITDEIARLNRENAELKLLNAIAGAEYARARIKAVPVIAQAENQRRANTDNSKLPRKTFIDGDGNKFSIVEIAQDLCKKNPNEKAKGLWLHLHSILDEKGLDPSEEITITSKGNKEPTIVFSQGVGQASIKLGTWRTTLSKIRKEIRKEKT